MKNNNLTLQGVNPSSHSNTRLRDGSFPCQPSGRCVIPSGRSSVHSSSRLDDVPYCPDARQTKASSIRTTWIFVRTLLCIEKLLFPLVSVRTIQQPVQTTLSDWSSFRFSFQNQIGEDCCNRPDALLLKASSQFKLNRSDVSLPWSGRAFNRYGNYV